MSNPMRYIKALEAAGIPRDQAEAQVQVVLDAIEGDLVTKHELALFKEQVESRFDQVDYRFDRIEDKFSQLELKMTVKLGIISVTTTSIAIAVLGWLIKAH